MWLMTKAGFFSVVQHQHDANVMVVRAREAQDLENVRNLAGEDLEIISTPGRDYPCRIYVRRDRWLHILSALGDVDYINFKDTIAQSPGQAHKTPFYHDIWWLMVCLQYRQEQRWEEGANAADAESDKKTTGDKR